MTQEMMYLLEIKFLRIVHVLVNQKMMLQLVSPKKMTQEMVYLLECNFLRIVYKFVWMLKLCVYVMFANTLSLSLPLDKHTAFTPYVNYKHFNIH